MASIASLLDTDYDILWPKEWQEHIGVKGCYGDNIGKTFELAGLKGKYKAVTNYFGQGTGDLDLLIRERTLNNILWGRRALLQLPSINYPGKSHLVAWSYDEVWDPSNLKTYESLEDVVWEWAWIFDERRL